MNSRRSLRSSASKTAPGLHRRTATPRSGASYASAARSSQRSLRKRSASSVVSSSVVSSSPTSKRAFSDSLKTIGTNNHERLRNRRTQGKSAESSSGVVQTQRRSDGRLVRSRTRSAMKAAPRRIQSGWVKPLLIAALALVLVVGCVGLVRVLPVFKVTQVQINSVNHVSDLELARLAQVSQHDHLLALDTKAISDRLLSNPWISDVKIYRDFPSTVKIIVTEKQPRALVHFTTANTYWYVSDASTWIVPFALKQGEDAQAQIADTQLVVIDTDESNANTQPNTPVGSGGIGAAISLLNGLSDQTRSQVATVQAPNKDALVLHLKSGVEVAFGEVKDIELKEQVMTALLNEHKNEVTYINVRVPKQPAWRGLSQ